MNAKDVPEPIWDHNDDARYAEWRADQVNAEPAPSSEAAQALKIAMDLKSQLEKLADEVASIRKRVDLLGQLEGDRIDKGVKPKPDYRALHRRRRGR